MSRVGKKPVLVPASVTVDLGERQVTARGPQGTLTVRLHPRVRVVQDGQTLLVSVPDPTDQRQAALWGVSRTLLDNLVQGVAAGYTKQLEISGIGFKAAVDGLTLTLHVGYSHPVYYSIPAGVKLTVEKNMVTVSGPDKQQVGQVAASVRAIMPPEPYKGKGIHYVGEVVRRKAGKLATKAE